MSEDTQEQDQPEGRKLRKHVVIHDPVTKLPVYLAPGDVPPDWAVITATGVWEGDEDITVPGDRPFDPNAALASMSSITEETTRNQLLDIAEQLDLHPGVDFPKSAGKDIIFAAIQHRAQELAEAT